MLGPGVNLSFLFACASSFANVPGRVESVAPFFFTSRPFDGLADRDERPQAPDLMPA